MHGEVLIEFASEETDASMDFLASLLVARNHPALAALLSTLSTIDA